MLECDVTEMRYEQSTKHYAFEWMRQEEKHKTSSKTKEYCLLIGVGSLVRMYSLVMIRIDTARSISATNLREKPKLTHCAQSKFYDR